MAKLVRQPVVRHPWRLHRWQDVDGMVGFMGIARQCTRCHVVDVIFPITMTSHRVAPEALHEADR